MKMLNTNIILLAMIICFIILKVANIGHQPNNYYLTCGFFIAFIACKIFLHINKKEDRTTNKNVRIADILNTVGVFIAIGSTLIIFNLDIFSVYEVCLPVFGVILMLMAQIIIYLPHK